MWVNIKGEKGKFEQLEYTTLVTNLRRLGKRAGIEKSINPHAFRHSRATNLAKHMTEQEMKHRIRSRMTPVERSRIGFQVHGNLDEDPLWLWEKGFKDRVINNSKREIEASRRFFPSVWWVLIDERNALMAARLAWIASKNLDEEKNSKIVTFVGAAHVEGIKELLMNPLLIKNQLRKSKLSFTEPTLIRRVAVQEN